MDSQRSSALLPSLFVSHGAPDLPDRPSAARDFLQQFGAKLDRQFGPPQSILVISAHWETDQPRVTTSSQPKTLHDFWGFPEHLYKLQYPVPGDPALAKKVVQLLSQAGFAPEGDDDRGLDHGVWSPLLLMYPDAQIPVVQLSLQPRRSPEYHWQLGQALAPLREAGVLVLASGGATHNLAAFRGHPVDALPEDWAVAFDRWLRAAIAADDRQALLNYRQQAPQAHQNHPSEEHLLPLFVALGAGGQGRSLHQSFTYGVLSMAAYAFV